MGYCLWLVDPNTIATAIATTTAGVACLALLKYLNISSINFSIYRHLNYIALFLLTLLQVNLTLVYPVNIIRSKSITMLHMKEIVTPLVSATKSETFFLLTKTACLFCVVLFRVLKLLDCLKRWISPEWFRHSIEAALMDQLLLIKVSRFCQPKAFIFLTYRQLAKKA